MKRLLPLVLLLNSVCVASSAQDNLVGVEHTMARFSVHYSVPLRLERVSGSGICIDPKCSVVVTANHIQTEAGGENLQVAGGKTSKVLSGSNESDSHRVGANGKDGTLPCSMVNDVAFIYTKRPIRHKSGLSYSYRYQVGDTVEVAGYYHGKFTTEEAHIVGADVLLQVGSDRLQDNIILDIRLKKGQSGSAVIDQQGQLIGMIILVGVLKANGGDITASVALSVKTIADALMKLDPSLGTSLFDKIPEEKWTPMRTTFQIDGDDNDSPEETSTVFPVLTADMSDVPDPVGRLRAKAAASADLLKNLIAKQCFTERNADPTCHEVAIIENQQIYREIGKDGKLGEAIPTIKKLRKHIWMQYEWAYTLDEIAENSWVFQGLVKDQYLFSFMASSEDDRCYLEEWPEVTIPLFVRRRVPWKGQVACFRQIVTDKDFNVLCVFTDWRPPVECLIQYGQSAIYFDSVVLEGVASPVLLPTSEEIVFKGKGSKYLRYASVTWTNYRKYRASHIIDIR